MFTRRSTTGSATLPARRSSARRSSARRSSARRSSARRLTTGAAALPARRSSARRSTTGTDALPARRLTTGAAALPSRRSSARRSTTGEVAMPARRSSARRSTTGAADMAAHRSSDRRSTAGVAAEVMDGAGRRIRWETVSDAEKSLGRTTLVRPTPLLSDLTDDTPRTLIKKIICVFPPASPVVPEMSKHEEPEVAAEEAQAELPAGKLSNISLSMSLGYLVRPDTVERRHLHRRPKNHKPIDIKAFEDKVEQDILRRKEMSPGIQTTMLTSVGTDKRRTQRYSPDLILVHEHVDIMTVSSKLPENPPENKQDHSQWTNPMEKLSVSEEVVVGETAPLGEEGIAKGGVKYQGSPEAECEIAQGIGAGSLTKHSNPTFSEKSGMEPLKDAVEQADELEEQAILVELDSLEEEPTEDEAEDTENEDSFMKMPSFVHAAAYKPPLLTPSLAKPAAPDLLQTPPLKPQQTKPVLKRSRKRTLEPKIPSSLIKSVFKDYAKMPVAAKSFRIVEKCTNKYFKQLWNDLAAFASHAGRKTVEVSDVEVLMRRQKLVTDEIPLHVLIERHLPLEYRKLLIPVAVSGNKVIPEIKRSSSYRGWKDA